MAATLLVLGALTLIVGGVDVLWTVVAAGSGAGPLTGRSRRWPGGWRCASAARRAAPAMGSWPCSAWRSWSACWCRGWRWRPARGCSSPRRTTAPSVWPTAARPPTSCSGRRSSASTCSRWARATWWRATGSGSSSPPPSPPQGWSPDALALLRHGVDPKASIDRAALDTLDRTVGAYLEIVGGASISGEVEPLPPPALGRLREASIPTVDDTEFDAAIGSDADRRRLLTGLLVHDGWTAEAWEHRRRSLL